MTTFYLNAAQIAAIASLHAATPPAKSDRERTPILTAIHLHITPATVTATATDRYIVAEHSFPLGETAHTLPDDGVTLQIASTDWQTIAKRKHAATFTWDDSGPVTVEYADGGTQPLAQVQGNYPLVARLFSDNNGDVTQGTALDLAKLARLAKIIPASPYLKDEAGVWEFSQPDGGNNPVTLTRPRLPQGESMRALIQPHKLR